MFVCFTHYMLCNGQIRDLQRDPLFIDWLIVLLHLLLLREVVLHAVCYIISIHLLEEEMPGTLIWILSVGWNGLGNTLVCEHSNISVLEGHRRLVFEYLNSCSHYALHGLSDFHSEWLELGFWCRRKEEKHKHLSSLLCIHLLHLSPRSLSSIICSAWRAHIWLADMLLINVFIITTETEKGD